MSGRLATGKSRRAGSGKGYDVAETIIVPQPSEKTQSELTSKETTSEKKSPAPPPNDPKEIVKKFWQGSFSVSRKKRLTQTRSRIRQQMLLSEELQRLEKETRLWQDVFSDLSGDLQGVLGLSWTALGYLYKG